MVKVNYHTFETLEQYKKDHQQRADKLAEYRKAKIEAQAKVTELQAKYEKTFTDAAKEGREVVKELDEIHSEMVKASQMVERATKDYELAGAAIEHSKIDTVALVEEFNKEFTPKVNKEIQDIIEPKLLLARDLIFSAIADYKAHEELYEDTRKEVRQISDLNKETGKTKHFMGVASPGKSINILGKTGARDAVKQLLHDIQSYFNGYGVDEFDYIEKAPKITSKKVGK